jgi:hypothetical protein
VGEGDGASVSERGLRGLEQIRLGLHAGQLGRLDEAVEEGSYLGPALGAGAVMILMAEDVGPKPASSSKLSQSASLMRLPSRRALTTCKQSPNVAPRDPALNVTLYVS